MIATVLATIRLLRTVGRAIADPATRGIVILAGMILLLGTIFYTNVEGWRALDSLYLSVVTLVTIGSGDLVPTTDAAGTFTIVYSLLGVGVIAASVTFVATTAVREPWDRRAGHGPGRSDHPGEATA